MYPLRKQFCTAILAADAGKPVKLPDEAKDKKARKWYIRANTDTRCNTGRKSPRALARLPLRAAPFGTAFASLWGSRLRSDRLEEKVPLPT